jgi:hypothetical protein
MYSLYVFRTSIRDGALVVAVVAGARRATARDRPFELAFCLFATQRTSSFT